MSRKLAFCNLLGDFSGHRFRMSAATTAAHVVISDHWIKTVGKWSSDEYKQYTGSSESVITSISQSLVY